MFKNRNIKYNIVTHVFVCWQVRSCVRLLFGLTDGSIAIHSIIMNPVGKLPAKRWLNNSKTPLAEENTTKYCLMLNDFWHAHCLTNESTNHRRRRRRRKPSRTFYFPAMTNRFYCPKKMWMGCVCASQRAIAMWCLQNIVQKPVVLLSWNGLSNSIETCHQLLVFYDFLIKSTSCNRQVSTTFFFCICLSLTVYAYALNRSYTRTHFYSKTVNQLLALQISKKCKRNTTTNCCSGSKYTITF